MSQITLPLDIKSLEVISQRIDSEGNIVFEVKSKNDHKYLRGYPENTILSHESYTAVNLTQLMFPMKNK